SVTVSSLHLSHITHGFLRIEEPGIKSSGIVPSLDPTIPNLAILHRSIHQAQDVLRGISVPHRGRPLRPFLIDLAKLPEPVEGPDQELLVERLVTVLDDAFEVGLGTAGRVIPGLAHERVHGHHYIGHAQGFSAGRKSTNRVAYLRGEILDTAAATIDQNRVLGSFEELRSVLTHEVLHPTQLFLRAWPVRPSIHRATLFIHDQQIVCRPLLGEGWKEQNVTCSLGGRPPTDVLRFFRIGPQIVDVCLRQSTRSRTTEPTVVVVEELTKFTVANCHDDQLEHTREVVQVGDGDPVDDDLAPTVLEGLQPVGHLHPAVNRNGVAATRMEGTQEVIGSSVLLTDEQLLLADLGGERTPEIEIKSPLVLQSSREGPLGDGRFTKPNLLR